MYTADPAPDFTKFIPTVLNRTSCKRHGVPEGVPCWHILADRNGKYLPLICNKRALRAGFVGVIDPRSLRRKV